MSNTEKKLVVREGGKSWIEAARYRRDNRAWLQISAEIALHVHELLRQKAWTKARLAEEVGVSAQYITKILKGHENLTLETISKLQKALGIKLITTRFAYDWSKHALPEFESAHLRKSYPRVQKLAVYVSHGTADVFQVAKAIPSFRTKYAHAKKELNKLSLDGHYN